MAEYDAKGLQDKDNNDVNFTPTHYMKSSGSTESIETALAECIKKSIVEGLVKNDGSVMISTGGGYPINISGNADTVDNYHVVVGSVGNDTNTIYFF